MGTISRKWTQAGLIDASAAERIRAFEDSQEKDGLRWPVLLAISLGGLLLGAGVLLSVAAHWDSLSPAIRFGLVLSLVAVFHISAALISEHFPALSTTFHAIGLSASVRASSSRGRYFIYRSTGPAE